MKKVKIIVWIIVLIFIGLVFFQNWAYFNEKHTLGINLFFNDYLTPAFTNLFFFITCFLIGLLIAYFYGLVARFKSSKLIKKLNETTAAQQEEISGLKQELEIMQKNASEIPSDS